MGITFGALIALTFMQAIPATPPRLETEFRKKCISVAQSLRYGAAKRSPFARVAAMLVSVAIALWRTTFAPPNALALSRGNETTLAGMKATRSHGCYACG